MFVSNWIWLHTGFAAGTFRVQIKPVTVVSPNVVDDCLLKQLHITLKKSWLPPVRTFWTETALFVGVAEPDEVPERNTEVQKYWVKTAAADPEVSLAAWIWFRLLWVNTLIFSRHLVQCSVSQRNRKYTTLPQQPVHSCCYLSEIKTKVIISLWEGFFNWF